MNRRLVMIDFRSNFLVHSRGGKVYKESIKYIIQYNLIDVHVLFLLVLCNLATNMLVN